MSSSKVADLCYGFEEYDTPLPIVGKSIVKVSHLKHNENLQDCLALVFDDGSTLLVISGEIGYGADESFLEFDYQEPQVEVLNNVVI